MDSALAGALAPNPGDAGGSGPIHRMFEVLRNRSIAHHLDDWGPEAGHHCPTGITRYGNTSASTFEELTARRDYF